MAKIFPFPAFHYNTKAVTNLSDVIVPPYDNIPEGDEKKYLARSPYNFAHVILPQSKEDDYSRSKALLEKWHSHGILSTDRTPGYYLYRQTFTLDGIAHNRDTLMCTVALCDFSEGVVRPHENTFGVFKKDRLQILRQTRSNLSHVFGMVKDPDGFLNSLYERWEFQTPLLKGKTDDGVENAIWKINPAKAPELTAFLEDKAIYIVDGHHRYESALMYAKETGAVGKYDMPASKMLFSIANSYDPGLVVLPTHRVVRGAPKIDHAALEKKYNLLPVTFEQIQTFVTKPRKVPEFGLLLEGKLYHCTPKNWQAEEQRLGHSLYRLSVNWSDRLFLPEVCGITDENRKEKVAYEKDARAAYEQRNQASLIIFHAPPAITDIMDVADEKKFMPQKSTYFYPKLAAGLIMREIS